MLAGPQTRCRADPPGESPCDELRGHSANGDRSGAAGRTKRGIEGSKQLFASWPICCSVSSSRGLIMAKEIIEWPCCLGHHGLRWFRIAVPPDSGCGGFAEERGGRQLP